MSHGFTESILVLHRPLVSQPTTLQLAQTHPLMTSHGEELSIGGDLLKPISVANPILKPRQNNVNHAINTNANNAKIKPTGNLNNFSIPGTKARAMRGGGSEAHYGTKPGHFEISKIHFPTSKGVKE